MQSTSKVVAVIIAGILVIGGVYYWYINRTAATPAPSDQSSQAAQAQNPTATGPTLPSGADTSDAALNADAALVASQMSAMTSDTAAIDSGLNDKPVSQ